MNPNTMTLDQLRDWLAERKGWEKYIAGNGITVWHRGDPASGDYYQHHDHPVPATLDAAAEAMPEGWWFWVNYCAIHGVEMMCVQAVHKQLTTRIECDGDTEILARFRLAALCILAEESAHAK